MTTARELLAAAAVRLTSAGVPTPAVDAELLLAHVTGRPRSLLRLDGDSITLRERGTFDDLVSRRESRVPLQHLTGRAPFRHLDLAVGVGVFIPRPESELLVDEVIRFAGRHRGAAGQGRLSVVDLCTGSAALALAIGTEIPASDVVAVELAPAALVWAQRNITEAARLLEAVGSTVDLVAGDATRVAQETGPLAARAATVDVVVMNPPYIPRAAVPQEAEVRDHDPPLALYGGEDGLDVIRLLAREARLLLRPGGLLVVEHADVQGWAGGRHGVPGLLSGQSAEAVDSDKGRPWRDVRDIEDLAGRPRHTCAIRATGRMVP